MLLDASPSYRLPKSYPVLAIYVHYASIEYSINDRTIYKNDDMKTTKIQFNGRSYYSRIVESVDGEELLIGSTILLDALQPGSFNDENEGFASKEAERIYDEIFFFTDERTLQLPENELIAELKKDNPDWFE